MPQAHYQPLIFLIQTLHRISSLLAPLPLLTCQSHSPPLGTYQQDLISPVLENALRGCELGCKSATQPQKSPIFILLVRNDDPCSIPMNPHRPYPVHMLKAKARASASYCLGVQIRHGQSLAKHPPPPVLAGSSLTAIRLAVAWTASSSPPERALLYVTSCSRAALCSE